MKTPDDIYHLSALRVRKAIANKKIPKHAITFVERMVHAAGDASIAEKIVAEPSLMACVKKALNDNAEIFCDSRMLKAGIIKKHLENNNKISCFLPKGLKLDTNDSETMSSKGIFLIRESLSNSIVLIGSAPTALDRLIDGIKNKGWQKPAAIIATPVGFVGAASSKRRLINANMGIPYLTITGRRGGAALTASAFNACLIGDLAKGINKK